jgi:hypothetical protein
VSLDFPKRADWLAIRATHPANGGRMLHVSVAGIKRTPEYQFSTYNVGRNKAKRAKRK